MPMRNSFIPDLDFEVRIAKGLSSLQEPLSVIIVEPEGIIEKPGNFRIPTTSCDHPIIDRATEYRRGRKGRKGPPTFPGARKWVVPSVPSVETRYGTLLSPNSRETVAALPADPGWRPKEKPVWSRIILCTAQFDRCLTRAFECGESRPYWLPLADGGSAEAQENNTVELTVKSWQETGYFALSPCGRGWGEGSHQSARPFGQGDWSCPAPLTPNPLPRGEREPEVPAAKSVFANSTVLPFEGPALRFRPHWLEGLAVRKRGGAGPRHDPAAVQVKADQSPRAGAEPRHGPGETPFRISSPC